MLVAADEDGITVRPDEGLDTDDRRIAYDEIATARTLFDWGTTTKPTMRRRRLHERKSTSR